CGLRPLRGVHRGPYERRARGDERGRGRSRRLDRDRCSHRRRVARRSPDRRRRLVSSKPAEGRRSAHARGRAQVRRRAAARVAVLNRPALLLLAILAPAAAACATGGAVTELKPGRRPPAGSDEAGLWLQMDRAERQMQAAAGDRKSTRLNSCHDQISYAVFCLKKKKIANHNTLGFHAPPISASLPPISPATPSPPDTEAVVNPPVVSAPRHLACPCLPTLILRL